MKFLIIVFSACALMVLVEGGARIVRSTEGSSSEEDARACSIPTPEDAADDAMKCVSSFNGSKPFEELETIEEYRQYFNSFCQTVPKFKQCLDGVLETSRICLNQTTHQRLQILVELIKTLLDNGCTDNGETLALIFHGGSEVEGEDDQGMMQCFDLLEMKSTNATVEPAQHLLAVYRNLNQNKDCFDEKIPSSNEDLKAAVQKMMEVIKKEMKCIHPEQHTLVLCSTIDSN